MGHYNRTARLRYIGIRIDGWHQKAGVPLSESLKDWGPARPANGSVCRAARGASPLKAWWVQMSPRVSNQGHRDAYRPPLILKHGRCDQCSDCPRTCRRRLFIKPICSSVPASNKPDCRRLLDLCGPASRTCSARPHAPRSDIWLGVGGVRSIDARDRRVPPLFCPVARRPRIE